MPRFTAADGAGLHYEDQGAGLPVLALAGLTRNSRDFDYLRPHLPGDVRFISMDYRGRGQSDWTGPETYTLHQEGADALALLDHLGIAKAAILGTSRGGLIAMGLAAAAKDRLLGVCLNDVGPVIAPEGLEVIRNYLGRPVPWTDFEEAARARALVMTAFEDVPEERWLQEARHLFYERDGALHLTYDARLRDAVLKDGAQDVPDLWPVFDALEGLQLACIRGANSDLLSKDTFAEMRRRRPDMIAAEVPGRGHIPFLDEAEAQDAIRKWLEAMR